MPVLYAVSPLPAAAVVRNVTASLSCTLAERLRISGTWAFKGLPGYWSPDTQVRHTHTQHHAAACAAPSFFETEGSPGKALRSQRIAR